MDRKGGIEGLPMELLIILVVASVGMVIIVGWMGNMDEQGPVSYGDLSSDVTMVTITDSGYIINGGSEVLPDFDVCITVQDSKGNPVSGAVVKLTGLGVKGEAVAGMTGGDGRITFNDLTLQNRPSGSIGYIIAVISSDIGESQVKIPVVVS